MYYSGCQHWAVLASAPVSHLTYTKSHKTRACIALWGCFMKRALTLCRFGTLLTCVFLLMEHYSQQKTLASALHLHLSYTFGFHEDPSHLVLALRCNDYLTALGRTTKGRHRISCPKQESHLVPCTGWCKWCKRLYFISLLAKTHLKGGGWVAHLLCPTFR